MKKRFLNLGLVIAMVLVVAVVFTACGGSSGGAAKNDPVGKYTATVNLKDAMNKEMAEAGVELSSDINANIYLELKEDNTFVLEMDADELAQSVLDVLKKDGASIFEKMFEAQGLSSADIDSYLSIMGYDSFEAFIDDAGEELVNEMKSGMGEMKAEGEYKIDGSKITLTGADSGLSAQDGTINNDGSITMKADLSEMGELELVFKK